MSVRQGFVIISAVSPLNISAMSYGALSKNAIMALNKGAKTGGFAHNTGEGGLSPYHQRVGGTVVKHYDEMYPPIPDGCLLDEATIPVKWKTTWDRADANSW